MFNIDISFWAADQMPVYIQDQIGYDTDTVKVSGGTRSYHWVRLFGWGVEITVARKTKRQEGEQTNGPIAFAQAVSPAKDT
jgi:hypothetical protein